MKTVEEVLDTLDNHDDRLVALEHVVVALCAKVGLGLHQTLMTPRQDS